MPQDNNTAADAPENQQVSAEAVESRNPAGTAPATPTQVTTAEAHSKHEEQRTMAEQVEAAKWDKVAAGTAPYEARQAAEAEVKAKRAAPENKALGGAPENKGA